MAPEAGAPAAGSDTNGRARPLRVAVVGASLSGTCGVHDHATLLAQALARENITCTSHWLSRSVESLQGTRAQMWVWSRHVAEILRESRPDFLLFHYSVFSYSYKGLPLFVRQTLSHLRTVEVPLITVMHEFAYPWMYGGARGGVWAVSQRAALIDVMRASDAVLVTADSRARWLESRPWLPRRPIRVAPVFSNLPAPASVQRPSGSTPVIGLFGYAYQGAAVSVVVDALGVLAERGTDVKLLLLGAPGRSSPAGDAWVRAVSLGSLNGSLSFSGRLPSQDLSNALAACDLLLCADTAGPSSRKGTLAGSLASGRPVIAIDGPGRWPELIESGAARVVPPSSKALADEIGALLDDAQLCEALGARGRTFAEEHMGIARSARAVTELLGEVLPVR
jgi:glycosyltransferase involved in cell wall biosynthesis